MKEIWKDVVNFEDKYEVSSEGNIRSKTREVPCKGGHRVLKGKTLKTQINKGGYLVIGLSTTKSVKTFTVHSLVMEAFEPCFTRGTEINHINGDKKDNRYSNLEESSPSHNQLHAVRTGLKVKQGVSKYRNVTYLKNPKAKKKWAASIRHNGKSSFGWKTFDTELEAAKYVDTILDSIGDTERLRNFPLNVQRPTFGKV